MSNTRGPLRRWAVAATVGLAGLALTACGALHPGAAVQVGDETISTDTVDEVAADFCKAVEPQLVGQAETIPNGYFRGGIAGTLALRSVADQLAAEHGVDPTDSEQYQQQITDLRRNISTVPEELRDSVVLVEGAPAYVEAAQAAVGERVLEGQGDYDDFVAAGAEEFDRWIARNEVEFDPSLNTTIEDGSIATGDASISFPVSAEAREGMAEQPNSVLARRMPAAHRCGR